MDEHSSKIRKVSRCRPTVSNKTILAIKQEFFFTKVAPLQSITDIVLLIFWLLLLHGIFLQRISFSNAYISVNMIFECSCLSFGWDIDHPLSIYVTRGIEGSHPKYVQVRTGREGYHASCVHMHLHYLFSCFCLVVSCFICRNLTLTFI